ncbi:adenylate/guanylate cyclase domain-containing protein [Aquimarina sp. 2201CG5-10]|uniref:adenylate/guanylate cyclase domain-containing protein n=1 Tax=Aquimarina callyspongiae TaxID=3098150 RepID=UPI002AB4E948|nr:adenylate/guanylate cyclase domain-containing protein [Aquimarina sp. 2201CG5-10]MDY8136135.1 adenylate/guanylate cyclase domain-containing protein [Aquimarina sp. 2201CG5-10]
MFRTFRHRLLFWFMVFISFSFVIIILSIFYLKRREHIAQRTIAIEQSYVMLLKSVKAQQDFFSYATKDQQFFRTGDNEYLEIYLKLLDSTRSHLMHVDFETEGALAGGIEFIRSDITEIDAVFLELIEQIQARGYKNYNLEGSMRKDAHWLEGISEIPTEDILFLRRHEKDYIMRNEKEYVTKFTTRISSIRKRIANSRRITKARKNRILYYLDGYHNKFVQLVQLDKRIGIKDNSGLKQKLDQHITICEEDFANIVQHTKEWAKAEFRQLTIYFILIAFFLMIVSLWISSMISRKITRPLTELTRHITRFVDSNFTLETEHPIVRTDDEIGSLTRNFSFLKDEVITRLRFFKQKVDERTEELATANKRLLRLSEANSRFVPQEFLQNLGRDSIEQVQLGDHVEREMTVIFSDIRGFTKISESLSPQENFDFINGYLSGIVPIIRKNGGFIDKFIGDSVMALFPDDPDAAIQTLFEFENFLVEFNDKLKKNTQLSVQIGTGIHTGNLILGTIGHDHRLETTVISDAVNTASRVEGLTKHYQAKIIGTEHTLSKLKDKKKFNYRFLDMVKVKGKTKTLSVYEFLCPGEKTKLAYLKKYNEGVKCVKSKKITEASKIFLELNNQYPEDRAVKIFLEKCQNFLTKKTSSWDEITHMITK